MKYRRDVCQREGLQISMKCMDRFHISEDVREEVPRLREAEKKKSLPTMEMVIRYMQKHLKFNKADNSLEQVLNALKDLNMESSVLNDDPSCSTQSLRLLLKMLYTCAHHKPMLQLQCMIYKKGLKWTIPK